MSGDDYPRLTRPEEYRPTYDDQDTGLMFAVIVSALLIIVGVAYAAALRLLFGG